MQGGIGGVAGSTLGGFSTCKENTSRVFIGFWGLGFVLDRLIDAFLIFGGGYLGDCRMTV